MSISEEEFQRFQEQFLQLKETHYNDTKSIEKLGKGRFFQFYFLYLIQIFYFILFKNNTSIRSRT